MSSPDQKSVSNLYLRNGHLFTLTVVIIFVAGFSALQNMPRLEDPVITTRNAQIVTLAPGSSAERVEALVSEPIEVAMQDIPEIKNIDSTSRAGVSVVAIELTDSVTRANNEQVFAKIRDELEGAARAFPVGTLPPLYDDDRGAVAFTLIVGITWTAEDTPPQLALLNREAENLADELRYLGGTDLVRLFGEANEQVTVAVDPAKASALGIRVAEVAARLGSFDAKAPSGILRTKTANFLLEVDGAYESIRQIEAIPLRQTVDGRAIRLADIAEVRKDWEEPVTEYARTNGQRTVYVAARVQDTQRMDVWSQAAMQIVEDFSKTLGQGVEARIVFDQREYTTERLGSLAFNLFLGAVVIFMVIFFTMGWRASIFVGSALPLTAALTVGIIGFSGGKLHQMSIFGMIIALGLLIDTAIVIADEVTYNLRKGMSRLEAVSDAVQHLFVPLLSSTLTTVLAFMPILLLPGNAGDFVGSIAGSVTVALLCSFFVAMALIASLTGRYQSADLKDHSWLQTGLNWSWASKRYQALLQGAVRYPVRALLISMILPFLGFVSVTRLGVEFFPRTDRDMFGIKFWLPTESTIDQTQELAQAMEAQIRQYGDVRGVHWMVGESFPAVYYNLIMNKDNSAFYGQGVIEATDFRAVKRLIPQIQADLDDRFPQAQIVVEQFAQGPPSEAGVEIRLYGPDTNRLQALAQTVRLTLAEHPDILMTRVTLPRGEPKLWVNADKDEALLAGMSLVDLAQQLQGKLEGYTGGSLLEDIVELPVRVRYDQDYRADLVGLQTTRFALNEPAQWVPLDAIGRLELKPELGGITRRNGERVNIVRGWTRNEALPIEATQDVLQSLQEQGFELPTGYRLDVGGTSQNQNEAVGNLLLYVPVIITATLAILILSFGSVRLAGILGVVAFLSVGYGFLATWLYNLNFSFNTILGSFGLVGLAFNGCIVVLASIRGRIKEKGTSEEALMQGVRHTTRHLISTTLTTIGSFIPLLIFIGGDFWPPLAIVLAGGVGGSTLLAMFFTPAAYRLLHRKDFPLQAA